MGAEVVPRLEGSDEVDDRGVGASFADLHSGEWLFLDPERPKRIAYGGWAIVWGRQERTDPTEYISFMIRSLIQICEARVAQQVCRETSVSPGQDPLFPQLHNSLRAERRARGAG